MMTPRESPYAASLNSSRWHGTVHPPVAGWVARRVVCWKKPGDQVAAGERIGLIRFGSRMDVWLPEGAEIVVGPGEHVAGGSSILARWT